MNEIHETDLAFSSLTQLSFTSLCGGISLFFSDTIINFQFAIKSMSNFRPGFTIREMDEVYPRTQ